MKEQDGRARPPAEGWRPLPLGGSRVGGIGFAVIAGPCAVESRDQLLAIARGVGAAGATALRGGAFKVRTDPNTFQGLGADAFALIDEARAVTGLPFIVEVTSPAQIGTLAEHADALQVGSRSMQHTDLLKALGQSRVPVLLKRGMSARLREWLLAAEYVARGGNEAIILCERGIRTFETDTRNTLDLAGAVWARQRVPYPVIADPSHGTGDPALVGPMCLAAAAAGLDGVMVEVHRDPAEAATDGFQALTIGQFGALMDALGPALALRAGGARSGPGGPPVRAAGVE